MSGDLQNGQTGCSNMVRVTFSVAKGASVVGTVSVDKRAGTGKVLVQSWHLSVILGASFFG